MGLTPRRGRVEKALEKERERVSVVNLGRKTEQMGKRREMEVLDAQWREAVTRNQQIQVRGPMPPLTAVPVCLSVWQAAA